MDTSMFVCGQTALEIWQLVRCLWKPKLDQLIALSDALQQLHIQPAYVDRVAPCPLDGEQARARLASTLERFCVELSRQSLSTGAPGRIASSSIQTTPAIRAITDGARLDLMVPTDNARRNSNLRRFHVFSEPVPEGMFIDIGAGICVASPRFALLQAMSGRTPVERALLTYELRGGYASDIFAKTSSRRCLPLVNASDLELLLDESANLRGVKALRQTLPLTLDHAASVAEAGMVLLLCAPRRMGGYGLTSPVLNKPLQIPAQLRDVVDWPWVACDALWERERVALEYDGREHNTASGKRRDQRRKNVLSTMGLPPIVMTDESFCNVDMFDQIARQIAKRIGFRMDKRYYDSAWEEKRVALRTDVIRMVFGEQALQRCDSFESIR